MKREPEDERRMCLILIFAHIYAVFVNSFKNFRIFSTNRAYVVTVLL